MTDLTLITTTDTIKTKDTRVAHGTDVFKSKALAVAHSTDSRLEIAGQKAHTTSTVKRDLPKLSHSTSSYKRSETSGKVVSQDSKTGSVLAAAQTQEITPRGEISKNSNTFLNIGSGLSILTGLPRIPTWNTPGRPKKPKTGTMGFNSQIKSLEIWDGQSWQSILMDQV